jgi:isopropylmalate/homocitrate/citramalate synthase
MRALLSILEPACRSKKFVRSYRSRLDQPVPMTVHHHDDFGIATAGTIAAVTTGAPDVSLDGVSCRSGFASTEEVALDVPHGLDTGIRLE